MSTASPDIDIFLVDVLYKEHEPDLSLADINKHLYNVNVS
jgi:hypothetical protein